MRGQERGSCGREEQSSLVDLMMLSTRTALCGAVPLLLLARPHSKGEARSACSTFEQATVGVLAGFDGVRIRAWRRVAHFAARGCRGSGAAVDGLPRAAALLQAQWQLGAVEVLLADALCCQHCHRVVVNAWQANFGANLDAAALAAARGSARCGCAAVVGFWQHKGCGGSQPFDDSKRCMMRQNGPRLAS